MCNENKKETSEWKDRGQRSNHYPHSLYKLFGLLYDEITHISYRSSYEEEKRVQSKWKCYEKC